MSTSEAMLLARHIDAPRALAARRRLLIAWCLVLGLLIVWWIIGQRGMLNKTALDVIVLLVLGAYVWAAVEGMLTERAMRASPLVCGITLVAGLIPLSAPIVVVTLLLETGPVVRMGRRMAANRAYDLSGITASVCPECGKAARP